MEQATAPVGHKRSPEHTEAWILGSDIPSLASAIYLIGHAKVPATKVHILDSHGAVGEVLHPTGNPSSGYDQFAGCLPVPIGAPLKELLASIPSAKVRGRSILDEIQTTKANRKSVTQKSRTLFLVQENGTLRDVLTTSLNLGLKHRFHLMKLMLTGEKRLGRSHIKDLLPDSFFQSTFWNIWSAQFGFQPWHSAAELRRCLRRYLSEFHTLEILNCLDITGYYQRESIFLPIYHYLQSLGVDFRFDTTVKNIVISPESDHRTVTCLDLMQSGAETSQNISPQDVVIATLGSTVSGCAVGTDEHQPVLQYIEPTEQLDESWSIWLELESTHSKFGNPYNFCTRQTQSMLESFTITTEDLAFFDHLISLSYSAPISGMFIILRESRWKLNLCLPTQPVFRDQPPNVRILWGFALFPESKGDFIGKPMLHCSGAEVISELLSHLNFTGQLIRHTVLIPRVMPRMSSILLCRAQDDRPSVIPQKMSNIGLVGQFVDIPHYSCVDMSYGVLAAETAVSYMMGLHKPSVKLNSSFSTLLKVMFWE